MNPIRPLKAKDATALSQLRLQATEANPECFCTTLHEVRSYPVGFYQQEIEQAESNPRQKILGYFVDDQLLGAVGVERLHGGMLQHRGRIWGLMVCPNSRRQGIARQLCEAAVQEAKQLEVEKLGLEVTGDAIAAMQLYRSLGFRIETIEPLALKLDGHYMDEIRMSLCF